MVLNYVYYHDKYLEMCAQFKVRGNFQALRKELGQKDEELMQTISRSSELEGFLRPRTTSSR